MRPTCIYLYVLATLFVLFSSISSSSSFRIPRAVSFIAESVGFNSSFIYPLLSSPGNVSTYSDANHTVPSTSFAAGSTVYAKGWGWPTKVDLTVNFTAGNVGEMSVPIVASSNVVQTDGVGSFASSLKLAGNGPPGVWIVSAELSPSINSSSRFVVYIPARTLPSFLIPGLIIGLGVGGLVGYLFLRRRADQANYYAAKSRSQR